MDPSYHNPEALEGGAGYRFLTVEEVAVLTDGDEQNAEAFARLFNALEPNTYNQASCRWQAAPIELLDSRYTYITHAPLLAAPEPPRSLELTSKGGEAFRGLFATLCNHVHNTADAKGWYADLKRLEGYCGSNPALLQMVGKMFDCQKVALIMREASEALEAMRTGNDLDKNCPDFSAVEIEFADMVIHAMGFCHLRGFDLGGAILAKMAYNRTRQPFHGNKLF